jgi:hypothetical protein
MQRVLYCFYASFAIWFLGGIALAVFNLESQPSLEMAVRWLPIAFVGIAITPYFRRFSTADSSQEAQRHLVARIRQCIYASLAELGIPSSMVHHSTR